MTRHQWRKLVNAVMFSITAACAAAAVCVLFWILGFLLWNGGKSLNLSFFTQLPKPPGEVGGGMANAIVGSAQIVLIASLMGIPIGFLGGIYLAEFGTGAFPFFVRYTADLLNGVPSIVMGIFAYAVAVRPMHRFSALAGGVALSVILIPTTIRTTEQFLRAVPQMLREGALALGASKWKSIATVVVPAAVRGVATGIILGIARIAGESAPLLFTSFSNQYWSTSLNQPTASLPVMIFTYAISPYADWHRQAWAAGLVLLALMLLLNISARLVLSPGAPRN
ncbi:MAG TPA: phosphate ABC transporter permease PstA [Bryobacteraceae bacterium]|nr:phosphate ABC transporter permease PstA [Bryobacteraceae bacterium]